MKKIYEAPEAKLVINEATDVLMSSFEEIFTEQYKTVDSAGQGQSFDFFKW